MEDPRRSTPRTDRVLADPLLAERVQALGTSLVKRTVAAVLDRCRRGELGPDEVVPAVLDALPDSACSLRAVVNATGVLVHTNLGRAPLSEAAVAAVAAASGSTDVELDLATGRRDRRGRGAVAALRDAVPAAGGAHVVNNGAAALALAALALAGGREVVVARGELVEIGDGFRIPELIEATGVRIREVGTTNRVRLDDYERAVTERTGFVLKVHPSNFTVTGFTSSVPVEQLAALPVPLVVDIGSGLLQPHPRLPREPDATTTLRAGASLVTASGDKLLGGPQAGLLLGDGDLVERLRRHPVARAMRVDKLTLAALEATLTGPPPPTVTALAADQADLLARAHRIADDLSADLGARAVASTAAVGGGGAPGVELPSAAVAVDPRLAGPLRTGTPPVVGHVERGRLLLDLLAVPPEADQAVVTALRRAAKLLTGADPGAV
ncbi:MAG TPA: L-seryl-tRNA(Sec) selenium transferase [Nocardioidaceae bacterium]|nr:L-seryl-tRNA(Sec) selenium transferase [Nocardioidaceae bacterium]